MMINDVLLIAIVVLVVVTLLSFVYIQYRNYNPKATQWNLLNLMAAITILLTLNSIIPQLLLVGRSESGCKFLHHWAGSFYSLTNGLARLFFQFRSNQIAPDTPRDNLIGNAMVGFILSIMIVSIVGSNLTMVTIVVPPLNLCVGIPHKVTSLVFVLVLPMLIDFAINIRFFKHIFRSTQQMSGAAGRVHAKAPMRLLRVTSILCVSCTTMSLICMLFLFGFVPLQNPTWVTVILATEQAYNACALAWPFIYIFIRKRVKQYIRETYTLSAAATVTTNQSKTATKMREIQIETKPTVTPAEHVTSRQ